MAPAATAVTVPAATPAASCPTVYWGSLPKTVPTYSTAKVTNVRTGRHTCYDRLVVDLSGKKVGYSVRYVTNLYRESGEKVTLTGGARLAISVYAPAYTSSGQPTYNPGLSPKTLNYTTFRQMVFLQSFEGQTDLGLSTRARLPMRAFILDGPGAGSRLVIDVAHTW